MYLVIIILGEFPEGRLQPDDVALEVVVVDGEAEEGPLGEVASGTEAGGPFGDRHVLGGREARLLLD